MSQSKTAAKNAGKKSLHSIIIDSNKNWKNENLSLNGIFKYFATSQGKADLKTFLTQFNIELKNQGKNELSLTDLNMVNFLESIKSVKVTFKGVESPYLKPEKKLFSVSFVLKGFSLAARENLLQLVAVEAEVKQPKKAKQPKK